MKNKLNFRFGVNKVEYNNFSRLLVCRGWVLFGNSIDAIKIYKGDDLLGSADLGFSRTDIYNKYPEYKEKFSGWFFSTDFDPVVNEKFSEITFKVYSNGKLIEEKKAKLKVFDKYALSQMIKKSKLKGKLKVILKAGRNNKGVSETSKCRKNLKKYCMGDGLDIGYGGDPIVPYAICMDLPKPYASYMNNPQHLHGDARNLYWFRDNSLDFIYSSHVLEDFANTEEVINEWFRVLKPGGFLVLFLPDEQLYRQECARLKKDPNENHHHDNFNIEHVINSLGQNKNFEVVHKNFPVGVYSFELVIKKL